MLDNTFSWSTPIIQGDAPANKRDGCFVGPLTHQVGTSIFLVIGGLLEHDGSYAQDNEKLNVLQHSPSVLVLYTESGRYLLHRVWYIYVNKK